MSGFAMRTVVELRELQVGSLQDCPNPGLGFDDGIGHCSEHLSAQGYLGIPYLEMKGRIKLKDFTHLKHSLK